MSSTTLSRRMLTLAAAAALVLAAGVTAALAGRGDDPASQAGGPDSYTIGLFGDMPYNAQGKADYPILLQDINRSNVAFSMFDGDLKAGGDGPCSDSLYTTALADFNSLERPLVWVPGDNDWTDCWGRYGPGTAPFSDPIERLNHERQLFDVHEPEPRQADAHADAPVERGRAVRDLLRERPLELRPGRLPRAQRPGLERQLSVPRHRSEAVDGAGRDAEIERQQKLRRSRARRPTSLAGRGIRSTRSAFDAKGVLIVWQADPNFNNEQHLTNPHDGDAFPDYVNALRTETLAFPGQVVLVHGDSHYFKVDKPLTLPSGKVLGNFTRVETFGAASTDWVQATIDPNEPQPLHVRADDRGGDRDLIGRVRRRRASGQRRPGARRPLAFSGVRSARGRAAASW